MSTIIQKENFISDYLIGTASREIMLFDLNRVAVRVEEHNLNSRFYRDSTDDWSLSEVELYPTKNKIVLKKIPYDDKDLYRPTITLKFPIEIGKDGAIDCTNELSKKTKLYLYERRKG